MDDEEMDNLTVDDAIDLLATKLKLSIVGADKLKEIIQTQFK